MKKILGISLVALMSVTAANAEIASKAYVDSRDGTTLTSAQTYVNEKIGTYTGDAAGSTTVAGAIAAAVQPKANSSFVGSIPQGSEATTIVGYINEKVTEAASDASGAISGLNATVSQTAGADGLALQVVETSGKLTSVTGSIAANTYDAYGAAGTAETNAKAYADTLDTAMGTRMTAAEGKITTAETNISNLQAADTAINTKIGTVTEGKTVVEMINDAKTAATYDDTALKARVTANETEIGKINDATTGIAAVAAADATTKANQALADAKGYTNTQLESYTNTTGMNTAISNAVATETTARQTAISGLDTRMTAAEGDIDALQAADTAINTKIGSVPANSTVMAEIAAAQSAATYNDTELRNKITANETAISNETSARTSADNTINGRIDAITAAEDGSNGVQVLTRKVVNGTTTYEWESIER